MFKGKGGSGGAGGQGSAPRNLLLETSFHFRPGKDDIEGIIGLDCSPSTSPLTLVPPFSSLTTSGSPLSSQTAPPLLSSSNAAQCSSLKSNDSDEEENKAVLRDEAPQTSITQVAAESSGVCSSVPTTGSKSTGVQDKEFPIPPPPPPYTPQHNAVKGLVSRFRKQMPSKDQKPKENSQLSEKGRKETLHSQSLDVAKDIHGKSKEVKHKELGLKEAGKDGGRDRDSRSPSPGSEIHPGDSFVKSSTKDAKDKEGSAAISETRDASWFGGIKGKIVRRFEETRARSQSMPVVPKTSHSQSDGAAIGDIEQLALSPSGQQPLDYEDVERAEEADPERMALEQGFGDMVQPSNGTNEVNEDDSWEKVERPAGKDEDIQQQIFYRDFAAVKARWLALDSAYIASRFPDAFNELKVSLCNSFTIWGPLTVAFFVLPSFVKGFLFASALWWIVWKVMGALYPPTSATVEPLLSPLTKVSAMPPPPLLMPRVTETNGVREGWLNALPIGESYNVRTHQGNHSHSVHIRLVGTTLRIRTPKEKLPRRAMWDERRRDINTVGWLGKQWFVELEGATVKLQPEGLSATRLWNKKYPIVISTVPKGGDDAKEIVLFTRTCRDKEYWFRLLKRVAEQAASNVTLNQATKVDNDSPTSTNDEGVEKLSEQEGALPRQSRVDFDVYMNNLGLAHSLGGSSELSSTGPGHSDERRQQLASQSCCPPLSLAFRDADTQWVNVVLGRLLFDFFMESRWAEAVRTKFQKKLSKIKVPFFMEELTITDIDLGSCTPLIRRTSAAVHDPETGVWLDLELAYNGCFQVTVLTKLNLMKLKKGSLMMQESREQEMQELAPGENRTGFDDDIPSEDDDDDVSEGVNPQTGAAELEEAQGATSKKILEMVDRISNWSVFQQATDYAFIRKKMEDVSNTDLKLTIRLTSLVGRLAINIPPPPTDRLWYGFRSVPRLEFKAIPQMGEREVSYDKLAGLIEKALFQEFQRVLVMPNMDDLQVDIMEAQPI